MAIAKAQLVPVKDSPTDKAMYSMELLFTALFSVSEAAMYLSHSELLTRRGGGAGGVDHQHDCKLFVRLLGPWLPAPPNSWVMFAEGLVERVGLCHCDHFHRCNPAERREGLQPPAHGSSLS
eukprot:2679137-Rhodomonas_salina.1